MTRITVDNEVYQVLSTKGKSFNSSIRVLLGLPEREQKKPYKKRGRFSRALRILLFGITRR